MMNSTTTTFNPPRSFGVFAPIGYLVIAFPREAEATKAREALLTGGYEEDEALMFTSQQVISDIENTRADISILAYMGAERGHQKQHLEYAKQGSVFLVVYAPTEPETARVMNVARRFGARLAHKYNRLTVETLSSRVLPRCDFAQAHLQYEQQQNSQPRPRVGEH